MNWNEIRIQESADFAPYHNGSTSDPERDSSGRKRAPHVSDRKVIAWDMEGMNLSGEGRPQHPVMFGCSAEVDNVLIAKRLSTEMMLDYVVAVGKRNPYAIHVGYGFRYDANMLVQDMPTAKIIRLYKDGSVRFNDSRGKSWRLRWIPGKTLTITLCAANKRNNISVTINDYASFFARPFIDAAEQLLGDTLTEEDRQVIEHGKAERGNNTWDDLDDVLHYWQREIVLMRRTFETFRDVMCRAGFPLKDWYGPGALANYLISSRGMRPKMAGAQMPSGVMPEQVHEASKRAFFGGRFELFKAGRSTGPIYAVDINSAYPDALRLVPDLSPEKGRWVHVVSPTKVQRFGFYRVRYLAPNGSPNETRPMPLPWRDKRGMIAFPAAVTGWYASPEARMMHGARGAVIHEGWYWEPYGEAEFPWRFLQEMYDTRMRLGKQNLMSMPFKLGPNSLYGKLAQTVGWNKDTLMPPRSHALPIAAWITSYCRAKLYTAMRHAPGEIIAVETDSIITTAKPETLGIALGDKLGEWDAKEYEEIVYVQSGMYHVKHDGQWLKTRSRGLHASEYTIDMAEQYLRSCLPSEDGAFPLLHLTTRPRFIGAGAANAASGDFKDNHCVWQVQTRQIGLGNAGKRRHIPSLCATCRDGKDAWESPHQLVVMSESEGTLLSAPRRLPWEQAHPKEVQELRDNLAVEADQSSGN